MQGVQQRGGSDDGGAVLVVVENGDVHPLFQAVLDFKTLRRLDIFQIDAAECRFQRGNRFDEFLRVGLIDLDVEDINTCKLLEKHALAFHDRLARKRADIAETEHGGAVGNHGDEIGAGSEIVRLQRIGLDGLTGVGDAGGVSERQVALVIEGFGRGHRDFAGGGETVITQGFFFQRIAHDFCTPIKVEEKLRQFNRMPQGWRANSGKQPLSSWEVCKRNNLFPPCNP